MTVKGFAQSIGKSSQAVYQKIKERGIPLDNLKDKDGKNLSADGLSLLASLFNNEVKPLDETDKELESKIKNLEEENALLKAEVSQQKAVMQMKDELIDTLKSQLDYMQKLQAATLQRIPDHRPTFLQRLLGRAGRGDENTVK